MRPRPCPLWVRFWRGYIEAALWTSNREDESETDIDSFYLRPMRIAARKFWHVNYDNIMSLNMGLATAGHNLWLTQNKHGAGFISRQGEDHMVLKLLADNARALGEIHLPIKD
jgi:hypothetical protein